MDSACDTYSFKTIINAVFDRRDLDRDALNHPTETETSRRTLKRSETVNHNPPLNPLKETLCGPPWRSRTRLT